LKVRKKVLSSGYVDRQFANADAFTMPIQELATQAAWGLVWTRPGLSLKTRSMLNIAMLVALGRSEELELHMDGALRNGVTKAEIQEILLHTSMYCGFPAALNGFRSARKYFDGKAAPRGSTKAAASKRRKK
jgi:4-carboxymuconolactone decarboxylase